jgi:hypothetical protein
MLFDARLFKRPVGVVLILAVCAISLGAQQAPESKFTITPDIQAAFNQISADSLRGHLSFIASDLLQGRNTPSPGLDTAAEYIAAQFRRAGLEPAGDDGYFQTAAWLLAERSMHDFDMKLEIGGKAISVRKDRVSVNVDGALKLTRAPVIKIAYTDTTALAALTPAIATGKVVITEMPDLRRDEPVRETTCRHRHSNHNCSRTRNRRSFRCDEAWLSHSHTLGQRVAPCRTAYQAPERSGSSARLGPGAQGDVRPGYSALRSHRNTKRRRRRSNF